MATVPYFTAVVDTTIAGNGTPLGTGMRPDQQEKANLVLVNGLGVVATAPAVILSNDESHVYTYNGDNTIHTETYNNITRTYTYDGSGNLLSIR